LGIEECGIKNPSSLQPGCLKMPENDKKPKCPEGIEDRVHDKGKYRDVEHPFGYQHYHKDRRHEPHLI
jgi:hypothetical protein